MINTRIYDRAPLKDVRVKEPQVGRVRTPQILMSRTNEGYQKGDILDANTTAILVKNLHNPDIEKLQEQIEEARRKLANAVMKESIGIPGGVASLDSTGNVPINQLANISTDLFIVVSELPTEDIKEGKIYCIKDTSSTAQDNGYIEYAYINNKWEKIGQFQAEPDLSKYARIDKINYFTEFAQFGNDINVRGLLNVRGIVQSDELCGCWVLKQDTVPNGYFPAYKNLSSHKAYVSDGSLADIGTQEDFVFTLEDGSTVTKSIRVISTTSQAGA